MISAKRFWLAASILLLARASVRAQAWQVGASAGLVNDVEKNLRLDGFQRNDLNVWVDLETDERVFVRATLGSLRVNGTNGGRTPAGSPVSPLPDLPDRVNYATIGVSYEYWEGVFSSGIFAGFGGYRIEPEGTAPDLESFRDPAQTIWGLHAGVDGSFKITSHGSLLARFTYHNIRSASGRSLLTANAGLAYRF